MAQDQSAARVKEADGAEIFRGGLSGEYDPGISFDGNSTGPPEAAVEEPAA